MAFRRGRHRGSGGGGVRPRGAPDTRRQKMSLRTTLRLVALVPSVALVILLSLGIWHLEGDTRPQEVEASISGRVGPATAQLISALQEERLLSAQALADPSASRTALTAQRRATDRAAETFRSLTGLDTEDGQQGLTTALEGAVRQLAALPAERRAVDDGSDGQQATYDNYTNLVQADINVLTAISHTTEGDATAAAQTLGDITSAVEMASREDAVLARASRTGRLPSSAYDLAVGAVDAEDYLLRYRVAPALTGPRATGYAHLVASSAWRDKTAQDDKLVGSAVTIGQSGQLRVPMDVARWRADLHAVEPRLQAILTEQKNTMRDEGEASVRSEQLLLLSFSALGLLAVILVIVITWRLTRTLQRRLLTLHQGAQDMRTRLPEVVERLTRGEEIDIDAEVPGVEYHGDELAELGQALNLARRSAVETAVRQARQYRGFELLLQRLARRTQLLIGLQAKKIDDMERKHEDPEVLEGLFDLDHLTARLRRYEENLVILGGGQPQRRWRRPVALLNVLRAAQSEVQDYRRVTIDVEGEPWVSERAVGPLTHVFAELMENAASFSRPPIPVDVRAGMVGRDIAVEVEDRGLGMEPEQYAAVNALMQDPPALDLLARVDDARLGLYVVARLAAGLGVEVELRPSAFGGTRVTVLIPQRLAADRPQPVAALVDAAAAERPAPLDIAVGPSAPAAGPQDGEPLPARTRGRAMAATASEAQQPGGEAPSGRAQDAAALRPLPQRVRQASLVPELRHPDIEQAPVDQSGSVPAPGTQRTGATIAAFQRQSRRAKTPKVRLSLSHSAPSGADALPPDIGDGS
jgi:two-component sensor histidine kinase